MAIVNIEGVSVILCCYNSIRRIKETLQSLSEQEVGNLEWEVILVDNASTDNTCEIATAHWQSLGVKTQMRILFEPKPGLGAARTRGILEARFGILIFCDDDNWLQPTYIKSAKKIMDSDPQIAACGGLGIPKFEIQKPVWFNEYAEAFALGPQTLNTENGKILNLYGAGLVLRKQAVVELYKSGFTPAMFGRTGKKLSSSEDTELTYALVLRGHKLHYSDQLNFFHFISRDRLTLNYLKKLFIAFGTDGPVRNLYYANISTRFIHKHITNWTFHLCLSLFRLIKYFCIPPKKYGRIIYFNWNLAYITELLKIRNRYKNLCDSVSALKENKTPNFISPNIVINKNSSSIKGVTLDNR